jgi:hypothetical protein
MGDEREEGYCEDILIHKRKETLPLVNMHYKHKHHRDSPRKQQPLCEAQVIGNY